MNSSKGGGLASALVYSNMSRIEMESVAEEYCHKPIKDPYGSLTMLFAKLKKAWSCWAVVLKGYTATPPQRLPCLKATRSNRVTIPKLLEPPFSAWNRSEFSFAFAFTIRPLASTTYDQLAKFGATIRVKLLESLRRYHKQGHNEQRRRNFHLEPSINSDGEGMTTLPPRISPPTPTLPARPPGTATPSWSSTS